MDIKLKNDRFKKNRGGYSRLLDISCEGCGRHLCFYQKDGLGMLKRMYFDRIYNSEEYNNLENLPIKKLPQLICKNCSRLLGVPIEYKKEKRLAFRLFQGTVMKKIVKSK
ncbi:MAG: hypothetical protein Q7K35_04440 [bacterium]|nr:hypothetical protein [bacterium]